MPTLFNGARRPSVQMARLTRLGHCPAESAGHMRFKDSLTKCLSMIRSPNILQDADLTGWLPYEHGRAEYANNCILTRDDIQFDIVNTLAT